MKEEMNYQKALNKSINQETIEIGPNNFVKDSKKFEEFKKKLIAITTSAALTVSAFTITKNIIKPHIKENDLRFETINQMLDRGYEAHPFDGTYDQRYYLIDDIDPFSLLIYMGEESALRILNYRGYKSWDDYAEKEGYENKEEWRKAKKQELVNPKSKERGLNQ